jgi:hypothetical protein
MIHRWVSDPVTQPFQMTGKAVLEFYTRAIEDFLHKGKICIYLFVRAESTPLPPLPPIATDLPILNSATFNPYYTYQPGGSGFWPRNAWAKIRFQMNFTPLTLVPGRRLGIALSVDRTTTDVDALQFVYEHHVFPTRLEVDTTTPIG